MTEKENIMRVFRGQMPAWLPRYGGLGDDGSRGAMPTRSCLISFMDGFTRDGDKDLWGVPYVGAESVNGATMPKPGYYILDRITRWRDVIKNPCLDDYDFEKLAAKDTAGIDREQSALGLSLYSNWFQGIIAFMGFEEALIAFYKEPEEVKALFDYTGSFLEETLKRALPTYRPDYVMLIEDTAAAQSPFISPQMYREFLKPYYKRFCDIALSEGIPIVHHNCGRCEDYIPDWMDLGVSAWEPAQVMNDLVGIKNEYGRRLAICGGWNSVGPAMVPGATEEVVREEVRNYIDTFAPNGGFAFAAFGLKIKSTEEDFRRHAWIIDEYENYGRRWYDKH
ncbi:MAG: veratrol--corrinoid protein metyltransferase [Clostridiales bacterium]|nr:veratrol--corrinoid protein metyltransferase [Clostridiales bacterium]